MHMWKAFGCIVTGGLVLIGLYAVFSDLHTVQMRKYERFTVNPESFARVLFLRNMRSFVKIKSSQNKEIILSLTDIGKSCPSHEF